MTHTVTDCVTHYRLTVVKEDTARPKYSHKCNRQKKLTDRQIKAKYNFCQ